MGVGNYLSNDDLVGAFTLRAKRLVAQESLSPYINEAASIDEKVDRLLFVEDNVIGVENKRQLAAFVIPVLQSAPFENHFQNPKLPLLARLQKLAQLQATGATQAASSTSPGPKSPTSWMRWRCRSKRAANVFESVEASLRQPCRKKAQTLLRFGPPEASST